MAFSFQCQLHLEAWREGRAALPACGRLCPAIPAPWYQTRLLPWACGLAPPPQKEPGWGKWVSSGALQTPDSEQKRVDLLGLFQPSWAKEETVEGSRQPRRGRGSVGKAERGGLSRLAGAGDSPWSETGPQCHGDGPDRPKSFLRLGGGLGPFSKRLLRSTNARTSLMAAREEPQLPASSVVQPGGRWGWWRWHHRGRGDPQCPGWASGEEAVRDKPLVTDSVHPPQEPRQRAQGRQPVLQGQSTEETPRSSYKRARVSIRQKPRLRTQEAELIHGCSAHRAAVCPGEACPRPDPPSEAP